MRLFVCSKYHYTIIFFFSEFFSLFLSFTRNTLPQTYFVTLTRVPVLYTLFFFIYLTNHRFSDPIDLYALRVAWEKFTSHSIHFTIIVKIDFTAPLKSCRNAVANGFSFANRFVFHFHTSLVKLLHSSSVKKRPVIYYVSDAFRNLQSSLPSQMFLVRTHFVNEVVNNASRAHEHARQSRAAAISSSN